MPALAKPPALLPRFVPHNTANTGADAGAGPFQPGPDRTTSPVSAAHASEAGLGTRRGVAAAEETTRPESADRLAHDARNVLSGLMLYCELLAAPGVLNAPHGHYAKELDSIARTATQILEKIIEASAPAKNPALPAAQALPSISQESALPTATAIPLAAVPVTDAAEDLRRLHPLLAAIAGPGVQLSVATMPCAGETALAVEDLTRILVNLVRNAADAMPSGGHIRATAQYGDGLSFLDAISEAVPGPAAASAARPAPRSVLLTVSDDGPGIPASQRAKIFDLGFSTRKEPASATSATSATWPAPRRRGLGLSIVRNLVEAAGGAVRVTASHTGGARFEITLPLRGPVTSGTYAAPDNDMISADLERRGA